MSLEHIHSLIAEAERELKTLTEKAQQQQDGKPTTYVFVYEQRYQDALGWGPNHQYIEAHSIGEAFQVLGRVIDMFNLTVRNVCYGTPAEMEPQLERDRQFWQEQIEKRRQEGGTQS